jgi:general stress protein YciG
MDPEKQRSIASKGGRAAHEAGTAHEFTPEEARRAGSKGGEIVSGNRAHMAAIGSKGGQRHGLNAGAEKGAGQKRGAKEKDGDDQEGGDTFPK